MNSSVKDKDNVTKMFVKETKQRLLKSFETFVETNIESQINSLLNKLMEDKIYKYESFVNTIIDHPLISSEINVYKNKIRSLEEKIHQIQFGEDMKTLTTKGTTPGLGKVASGLQKNDSKGETTVKIDLVAPGGTSGYGMWAIDLSNYWFK